MAPCCWDWQRIPGTTALQTPALRGPVRRNGTRGSVRSSSGALGAGRHGLAGSCWVSHDGLTYAFPDAKSVELACESRSGSWQDISPSAPAGTVTHRVFTAWLNHGVRPRHAAYEYGVLAGATATDLRQNRLPGLTTLANTAAVQAVHWGPRQVFALALYEPGALALASGLELGAEQPCLLLLWEDAGGLTVAAADPCQTQAELVLQPSGRFQGPGATASTGGTRVVLALPRGLEAGLSA